MPWKYYVSQWPTLISDINDTVWKQPSLDIQTLLNSLQKAISETTNNNRPFSPFFEVVRFRWVQG